MTSESQPSRAGASMQATGTAFVLAATLAWSFSGIFTRLLTTDVMTAIAWRSFFGGSFLVLPFVVQNGRRSLRVLAAVGWPGLALVIAQAVCQAATVGAFYRTSIANVAVIYATAPFMAAGLAYWLIGERMPARTLLASAVAFAGVLVIVSNGFGTGHLGGDLIALLMTATFAVVIVIPRAWPGVAMMPSTILSSLVVLAIFGPFGHAGEMPGWDWGVLAAFGFTNFTVAMYLFLAGSRRIAAAQAALIGTLEIVLSPLWVWLVFRERPGWPTVLGGAMILAVVVWHTFRDLQAERSVRGLNRMGRGHS